MTSQHKKIGQETGKLIHYIHGHVNPWQKLIMEIVMKTRSLEVLTDGTLKELLRNIFEDVESEH